MITKRSKICNTHKKIIKYRIMFVQLLSKTILDNDGNRSYK